MGYNLLIKGVYWDYNPLILTIDPNFLGHPSTWRIIPVDVSGDRMGPPFISAMEFGHLEGVPQPDPWGTYHHHG